MYKGAITNRQDQHHSFGPEPTQTTLTPRESQVIALISEGFELKEVAWALGVRYHTIKMHLMNVKHKMYVRNTCEMILLYRGHRPRSLEDARPNASRPAGWARNELRPPSTVPMHSPEY